MPTFETHEPISVTIEMPVGQALVVASDRHNTVVEVRPRSEASNADKKAVENTRVEYSNGRLLVKAPKWPTIGRGGTIDVTIELPAGSKVTGDCPAVELRCEGRLGEVRFDTEAGGIRLEEAGAVHLKSGAGSIIVGHAASAELRTGTGRISVGQVDGHAVIRNSNGTTNVGEVEGELRINTSNGDIAVERAQATVFAKTSNGSVRIGEVVRGTVVVESTHGDLEVGIRQGTAAWLDLGTKLGSVHNTLESTDAPAKNDETVKVRAHTNLGNIDIRRAV